MNTIERVKELAEERGLTLAKVAVLCDISHSIFSNCERRGGQLKVETIERVCSGLNITMAEFFTEKSA